MAETTMKIRDGEIKGTTLLNTNGDSFHCFYGIPYGKPPVGELRFKAPQPVEPWKGVKDATKDGPICYQKGWIESGYQGSEDCLHLSVFTKTLPNKEQKLKPVMVWIHGGAFVLGSNTATMQSPEILMSEDIVLVLINYRLGVLGFLSLSDPSLDVPGNAGLKDQTLALKWVKDNIKSFNGDPGNVTIFGGSAGSASVHFQVLTPTSKGLFHKAIMQSGSVLNPWPYADDKCNEFVKFLDKKPKNDKELYGILKNTPLDDLVKAQDNYMQERGTMLGIFGPVIEAPNPTAFLTRPPIELLASGEYNHVPMIHGFTSDEGLLLEFQNTKAKMEGKDVGALEIEAEDFIPHQMKLKKGDKAWKTAVEKLEKFYFDEKNKCNKYAIASDDLFATGIIASVRHHAKTTQKPVYLYRMSLVAGRNMLRNMINPQDPNIGAAHGDDGAYLFESMMFPNKLKKGDPDYVYSRRFVLMWTNFARDGDPTSVDDGTLGIKWPTFRSKMEYLEIDKELSVKGNPEGDRMEVWKEVYMLSPHTKLFL